MNGHFHGTEAIFIASIDPFASVSKCPKKVCRPICDPL